MNDKLSVVILTIGILCFGYTAQGFCQQETSLPSDESVISEAGSLEENVSWVWGEIKNVDSLSSRFNILYMDYQTDDEKELVLTVNQDTKFEGAQDLNSLKAGDTVGVDYYSDGDKNIAKNISVEKLEEPSDVIPAQAPSSADPDNSQSLQPDETAIMEAQPEQGIE